MKNLIGNWLDGLSYLINDDIISFYTFFTVIFAECSYLWAFHESTVAIPITVILLGYMLNVIIFACLKGFTEGTKLEKVFSILYVSVFVTLFVIGCFFNWAISTITTVILLGVTALGIIIKNYTNTIIIIGEPFVVFWIFFVKISFLPIALKVIIPLLYLIFSPLIAFFEDNSATCNIFELAYDITWNKEYEKYRKKFENLIVKNLKNWKK